MLGIHALIPAAHCAPALALAGRGYRTCGSHGRPAEYECVRVADRHLAERDHSAVPFALRLGLLPAVAARDRLDPVVLVNLPQHQSRPWPAYD
jgi:hypothetical protein